MGGRVWKIGYNKRMNGKAVNVSKTDDVMSLYREVVVMREALEKLYKKIVRVLPAKEGTEEWWAREMALADEDIKAGRVTKFENVDQLIKWLDD